jgi:hypothetical protein
MMSFRTRVLGILAMLVSAPFCTAQASNYRVIPVENAGTIKGSVKWQGPLPHLVPSLINKEPQICDPDGQKHRDLERLIISANNGVANTVVFLKNVTEGKAMDLPETRRLLNQKSCRYEPHVLLVPLQGNLQVKSSDPTLHTVHMSGAAEYNLPFPFKDMTIQRTMTREGLVDLRCNAGHVWMNAEMMVAPHPYYAVTDQEGNFTITQVPPGTYEIVAWHEGWKVVGESDVYDVMTQLRVKRPVFSAPVNSSKHVTVPARDTVEMTFTLSERNTQVASVQ